jgi:hypothetical protein
MQETAAAIAIFAPTLAAAYLLERLILGLVVWFVTRQPGKATTSSTRSGSDLTPQLHAEAQ